MSGTVTVVGRVKQWSKSKGYGFLVTGVGEVFVQALVLERDRWPGLAPGTDVTAQIKLNEGDARWRAVRVLAMALPRVEKDADA